MTRKLTIGALSERTGVSVRTLRFYSDEGLLKPLLRSRSGYRLYGDEHVGRVALIRSLREAGVSLEEIRAVLLGDASREDVLRLRLRAVEGRIAELAELANALRSALGRGPTNEDPRRRIMASSSNEDRKKLVAAFYEKVVEGLPAPRKWVDGMIEASTPAPRDSPSGDETAAWAELEALLAEERLLACKRINARDVWAPVFAGDALFDAQIAALTKVQQARARGAASSSSAAAEIVEGLVDGLASTSTRDRGEVREHLRTKYDPSGARYWELVAALRGEPSDAARLDDWRWLGEALARPAVAA